MLSFVVKPAVALVHGCVEALATGLRRPEAADGVLLQRVLRVPQMLALVLDGEQPPVGTLIATVGVSFAAASYLRRFPSRAIMSTDEVTDS